MNPKMCPTCGKQGVCYDSRKRARHITRNYKCLRDDTRWQTRETFLLVKARAPEATCSPPT